jgi:hypothetical protein
MCIGIDLVMQVDTALFVLVLRRRGHVESDVTVVVTGR